MPKRIQRKRERGWRMPPKTLYMGRVGGKYSIWANEWRVLPTRSREKAVELHMADLRAWRERRPAEFENLLKLLRGYDYLACWCSLDVPCHVDNWLYFLNEE